MAIKATIYGVQPKVSMTFLKEVMTYSNKKLEAELDKLDSELKKLYVKYEALNREKFIRYRKTKYKIKIKQ